MLGNSSRVGEGRKRAKQALRRGYGREVLSSFCMCATMRAGLDPADREIAWELRQRLAQGVQIEDFRVYGSRVRGEATPDSDLDIYLVVAELTPALRRWIDEIAWEVGFDNDRVISTLVTTRRGLEQGPFGAQPVVQTIEREGIAV